MIAHTPTALSLPLRTARVTPRAAVVPPADVEPRFTADGSVELEQHLARTCAKIAAGIRGLIPARKLEAILLGGGYGRGEGGVLASPTGDRPYNDLEFYVYLRGNRHWNERRFGRALHVLGEILTPQAGVEVEFKIASLGELERSAVSMFSYDLVTGHRWLVGNDDLLAGCAHHRDAAHIPISEATRLLMNRCSGLLFARERLEKREFTANDADFTRRNIAKAELALGDALLVAFGQYHWSVRHRHVHLERLARSETLPWLDAVRQHHAAGVAFKLRPERSTATREELAAQHAIVTDLAEDVLLWIEERRLRTRFLSARSYAQSEAPKWPDTLAARNAILNVRALGPRALLEGRAGRHPRERVLNALALLLWEPTVLREESLRHQVQCELQTKATALPEIMHAYRDLWSQSN